MPLVVPRRHALRAIVALLVCAAATPLNPQRSGAEATAPPRPGASVSWPVPSSPAAVPAVAPSSPPLGAAPSSATQPAPAMSAEPAPPSSVTTPRPTTATADALPAPQHSASTSVPQPAATTVIDIPPQGLTLVLRGIQGVASAALPVLPMAVPTFPASTGNGPVAQQAGAAGPTRSVGDSASNTVRDGVSDTLRNTVSHTGSDTASGLPWRSGVFGHSLERTVRFQEVTGRPIDVIGVAPSRGSWESIMDGWWLERAPEGFRGTLDVAVPLWQEDGDLATAAAGGYNAQWVRLGRAISQRYPGSTVRIGWEFNLRGWSHHADEGNVQQWKQAFRHASAALKQGGPSLLVTWNPNKGRGESLPDAALAWPGDDVVDIVGLDAYDWWPAYSPSTWPEHRDADQGWAFWVDFARSHGTKFSVPEWGLAPGNDHGGGDNPYYVQTVMDYLASEHAKDGIVHSVLYFDETEPYIANSIADGQVPQAGAAYREAMDKIAGATPPRRDPAAATPHPDPTVARAANEMAEPPTSRAVDGSPADGPAEESIDEVADAQAQAPAGNAMGDWVAPAGGQHGPIPQ